MSATEEFLKLQEKLEGMHEDSRMPYLQILENALLTQIERALPSDLPETDTVVLTLPIAVAQEMRDVLACIGDDGASWCSKDDDGDGGYLDEE